MDTTPEFVKMCEKAYKDLRTPQRAMINNELQCLDRLTLWARHYKDGTYFAWIGVSGFENAFPIYQQDQLQDRLPKRKTWFENLYRFYQWIREPMTPENWNSPCIDFQSMEQLWLAFVMSERYSKIWNGEDWVADGLHGDKKECK